MGLGTRPLAPYRRLSDRFVRISRSGESGVRDCRRKTLRRRSLVARDTTWPDPEGRVGIPSNRAWPHCPGASYRRLSLRAHRRVVQPHVERLLRAHTGSSGTQSRISTYVNQEGSLETRIVDDEDAGGYVLTPIGTKTPALPWGRGGGRVVYRVFRAPHNEVDMAESEFSAI